MRLKLLAPFDKYAGQDTLDILLKEPLTTIEFIEHLFLLYPGLRKELGEDSPEDVLTAKLMLIRDGKILQAQDVIHNEDTIKMIPPIMGG